MPQDLANAPDLQEDVKVILAELATISIASINHVNFLLHNAALFELIRALVQNIVDEIERQEQPAGGDELLPAMVETLKRYYSDKDQQLLIDADKAHRLNEQLYQQAQFFMATEKGFVMASFVAALLICQQEYLAELSKPDLQSWEDIELDNTQLSKDKLIKGIDLTIQHLASLNDKGIHDRHITQLMWLRYRACNSDSANSADMERHMNQYEAIMQKAIDTDPKHRAVLTRLVSKVVNMVSRAMLSVSTSLNGLFGKPNKAKFTSNAVEMLRSAAVSTSA